MNDNIVPATKGPRLTPCRGRLLKSGMTELAFLIAGLIVGIASCTNTQNTQSSSEEFKTRTHKTIIISETHPVAQSVSTINISTKDFTYNHDETYENVDPISRLFQSDLKTTNHAN